MDRKSPSLKINELRIIGIRKNYSVKFESGLNIVYGDSDTGKSSILNLINYCLGASNVDLYDELESSTKECLLEVNLNKVTYTIKRDIFNQNKFIEVYKSNIENIDNVFPCEYAPKYSNNLPKDACGFFGDFLLESLNIPKVRIKKAPTKINSELVRLGFRQIFKYCYMDQDEVGSKKLLDLNNKSVHVKNKETFKFINNILDSQITELQNSISEKLNEKISLNKKYEVIGSFLRETQVSSSEKLECEIKELDKQLEYIDVEIHNMTNDMLSNTDYLNELRETTKHLNQTLSNIEDNKIGLELQIEKNLMLKREYEQDIIKLETSKYFEKRRDSKKVSKCPICEKDMLESEFLDVFTVESKEAMKIEKNTLNRRKKSLLSVIDKNRNDLYMLEEKRISVLEELNKAEKLLDEQSKEFISPYTSQRDGLIHERATIIQKQDKLRYTLKIRTQLDLIQEKINTIDSQISELTLKLNELTERAPSFDIINSNLSDDLYGFLKYVGVKNLRDVSIDKKDYLPSIRGRRYSELTSGGLRTLVSVGYYISMLINSLERNTQMPSLMIIDTVGKYLGKVEERYKDYTDKLEDEREGLTDPEKYKNIYKYILNICDRYKYNSEMQIIIVDNDIPNELASELNECVVKRFSSIGKVGYEVGLIDDVKIKTNEYNISYYIEIGDTYYSQSKLLEALDNYNKAIELDCKNASAYNKRGNVYYNLQQFEEAIDNYNKAIELDETYVEVYNRRGDVNHRLGRLAEAISDYNKAIKLKTNDNTILQKITIIEEELRNI